MVRLCCAISGLFRVSFVHEVVTKPTLVVLEQLNKQKERKDKSKGYAGPQAAESRSSGLHRGEFTSCKVWLARIRRPSGWPSGVSFSSSAFFQAVPLCQDLRRVFIRRRKHQQQLLTTPCNGTRSLRVELPRMYCIKKRGTSSAENDRWLEMDLDTKRSTVYYL